MLSWLHGVLGDWRCGGWWMSCYVSTFSDQTLITWVLVLEVSQWGWGKGGRGGFLAMGSQVNIVCVSWSLFVFSLHRNMWLDWSGQWFRRDIIWSQNRSCRHQRCLASCLLLASQAGRSCGVCRLWYSSGQVGRFSLKSLLYPTRNQRQ